MVYHILNGDCLKSQFPKDILGELIIVRECLADGTVEGESLDDFFENRAKFIIENDANASKEDYFEKVVVEFEELKNIPNHSVINLWFEEDLFCQVNLWFTIHYLNLLNKTFSLYLVLPKAESRYSFGNMSLSDLKDCFENKIKIGFSDLEELVKLWNYYKNNNLEEMLQTAKNLNVLFPFIYSAVQAHKERLPNENGFGKIEQTILQIVDELQTQDFEIVFKEFSAREPIYGFGDTQIKRIFDDLLQKNKRQ